MLRAQVNAPLPIHKAYLWLKLEWRSPRDILGIEGHLSIIRCDMQENVGLDKTCTAPAV